MPARRQPSDPCSPLFTHSFLSCFPCVLSPVVLLRLLLHRLLTTAAHLQRWKSCASRSSFASASAHDVPRSPRSRASSTDTEPSSLRKRRKVSISQRFNLKIDKPWKAGTLFRFERSDISHNMRPLFSMCMYVQNWMLNISQNAHMSLTDGCLQAK